jgi:hypothetical protein
MILRSRVSKGLKCSMLKTMVMFEFRLTTTVVKHEEAYPPEWQMHDDKEF